MSDLRQLWFPGFWRSMDDMPRYVIHGYPILWVEGLLRDGSVVRMHKANGDGDGLMPPFDGWFKGFMVKHWSNERQGMIEREEYSEVDPIAWRLIGIPIREIKYEPNLAVA